MNKQESIDLGSFKVVKIGPLLGEVRSGYTGHVYGKVEIRDGKVKGWADFFTYYHMGLLREFLLDNRSKG